MTAPATGQVSVVLTIDTRAFCRALREFARAVGRADRAMRRLDRAAHRDPRLTRMHTAYRAKTRRRNRRRARR